MVIRRDLHIALQGQVGSKGGVAESATPPCNADMTIGIGSDWDCVEKTQVKLGSTGIVLKNTGKGHSSIRKY